MEWPDFNAWEEKQKGMSFTDAVNLGKKNRVIAKTDEVKPKAPNKFIKGLKKLDGQDSDGKGGGRLAGAAAAISKFQGYREVK